MIISTHNNSYLLFFKRPPSRQEFLHRLRIRPGSHAEEMMSDIYAEVFVHSRELRRQYLRYYASEYPQFSQFVDVFADVPSARLSKMNAYFDRYDSIIWYRGVPNYLTGEEGLRLLCKLFRLRMAR